MRYKQLYKHYKRIRDIADKIPKDNYPMYIAQIHDYCGAYCDNYLLDSILENPKSCRSVLESYINDFIKQRDDKNIESEELLKAISDYENTY